MNFVAFSLVANINSLLNKISNKFYYLAIKVVPRFFSFVLFFIDFFSFSQFLGLALKP